VQIVAITTPSTGFIWKKVAFKLKPTKKPKTEDKMIILVFITTHFQYLHMLKKFDEISNELRSFLSGSGSIKKFK